MLIKEKRIDVEKENAVYSATVEEALNATGFGKYNFGLLLVCSWTLQAMGMDLFGTSFVVAAAVCDLELNMQQRALLTATPLIGVVLGAQIWGYISDTKGRRITLVLSMSVGFVFAALSSFAPNWKVMALLKLISSTLDALRDSYIYLIILCVTISGDVVVSYLGLIGVCSQPVRIQIDAMASTSASNSASYTLLGESCSEFSRGRSMLLCNCFLMCSQAVVALFAYPILPLDFVYWIDFLSIKYRSWRLLALVMSLPCAATACLLQLFHESPKFLVSIGQNDQALEVLKKIYACNTGEKADSFCVKKLIDNPEQSAEKESFIKTMWHQTIALFRPPLLRVTLKLFYLVTIIYMTGSGFILWLPYIMNNLFSVLEAGGGEGMNLCTVIRYSTDNIGVTGNDTMVQGSCNDTIQNTTLLSAMTYGALASLTNLVLSLTCGSRKRFAMICIISTSAVAAILLNVIAVPIAGGIFFFFFLLCALSMGILSVYFVELYPTSLRGMASCLSVMLGRSSAFFGVNAIGALISANCEATFYGWSVLLFTAVVLSWYLPKDNEPKK